MSEQVGYKLVIIYNKEQDKYHVTGFSQFKQDNSPVIHSAQDGATLHFDSFEQVKMEIESKGDIARF